MHLPGEISEEVIDFEIIQSQEIKALPSFTTMLRRSVEKEDEEDVGGTREAGAAQKVSQIGEITSTTSLFIFFLSFHHLFACVFSTSDIPHSSPSIYSMPYLSCV